MPFPYLKIINLTHHKCHHPPIVGTRHCRVLKKTANPRVNPIKINSTVPQTEFPSVDKQPSP